MDGHESTITAELQPDFIVRKWDVVDWLRRQTRAQSYAQFVSASTSYDMLERPELARFGVVSAIAYASAKQRIDWPWTQTLPTLAQATAEIRRRRITADIVFADPWHTYADSVEVLSAAWTMVRPGGHLVVHDCNPIERELAFPQPTDCNAFWCGDTWRAFVDFTAGVGPDVIWFVVDDDHGVGVVRRPTARHARDLLARLGRAGQPAARRVPAEWDFETAWRWLDENRIECLRLVSAQAWTEQAADPLLLRTQNSKGILRRRGAAVPRDFV